MAAYQRAAAEAITRLGGEVMRYVGDGIMAFFGYPTAHENDAERAARAGLAILDAIAQLNQHSGQPQLAVRIGIHSGSVVVGMGAGQAVDAFGDAANIAARVQAAANQARWYLAKRRCGWSRRCSSARILARIRSRESSNRCEWELRDAYELDLRKLPAKASGYCYRKRTAAGSGTKPSAASVPYAHPRVTRDKVFARYSYTEMA